MRGIDHAQTAFAQLAFEAEARQSRQLRLLFGWRAALLTTQFAHVQPRDDPFASFLSHRFGQLRHEILDLRAVREVQVSEKNIGVRRGVHRRSRLCCRGGEL
jgi:hypothetical protein